MRIVHYFRSPVGGVFRHVRDLVGQQIANQHSVGIICDSTTGSNHENRLFAQIKPKLALGLHRIPIARSIGPRDFATLLKSHRLINEIKPDIVHTHSAKGGFHGRLAGKLVATRFHHIKTFYSPHGGAMHYETGTLKGCVFFFAERMMERFTDTLIFVSEYEQNAYHEKVGKPSCAQAVVINGLAENEFQPVPAGKHAADFLYIGMMRHLKGPDVFIDALKIIRERTGKNLTAMFIGDGPEKLTYIKQINQLGLTQCVFVHDAMPARDAFARAQMVVVPSRTESMPYLVLEAIAAQKPVIATQVGGIPEIFTNPQDKLAKPGDPEALADLMQEKYNDPNRQERAAYLADQLHEKFSLQHMASHIQKIYNTAL